MVVTKQATQPFAANDLTLLAAFLRPNARQQGTTHPLVVSLFVVVGYVLRHRVSELLLGKEDQAGLFIDPIETPRKRLSAAREV